MARALILAVPFLVVCNNRVKTYSPVISGVFARRLPCEVSRRAVRPVPCISLRRSPEFPYSLPENNRQAGG